MRDLLSFVAARRWAGVALAAVLEAGILVGLAKAGPTEIVGVPGAVTAAIGGTVAVVYGAVDGTLLALLGALVFGFVGGWEAGAYVSLAVWPAVVGAAGLFARRVERRRLALGQVVASAESERERYALELHDDAAQTLAAVQLTLRRAEHAVDSEEAARVVADARELLHGAIQTIREIAVDLRPKSLDDFGIAPAVERLAETVAERTGTRITIDVDVPARPRPETELAVYRVVREALTAAAGRDAASVDVRIGRAGGAVTATIEEYGAIEGFDVDALRERARLGGGKLSVSRNGGSMKIAAEFPA